MMSKRNKQSEEQFFCALTPLTIGAAVETPIKVGKNNNLEKFSNVSTKEIEQ